MPIINNQNFLRYITYLTDEPLSLQTYNRQGILVNQPNITEIPLGDSLLLTPYDPTVITDMRIKVLFSPLKGDLSKSISEDIYEFIILYPVEYHVIQGSGEFRPFMIAYEISQSIDSQYEIAGVSKIEMSDWRMFKVNDTYAGLSVWVNVSNGTLRG